MSNTPSMPLVEEVRAAGNQRWWVLAAAVTAAMARNLEPPASVFLTPETQAFNAGWATYGFWMSVVSLAVLAFLLIGGVLGDIFGRRRVMLIGIGGLIAGNLLVLFSPALPWFVSMRVVAALCGTLVLPLSLSMLYLAFDDDAVARGRAIAIYVLCTSSAVLFAGLLGQVMRDLFDWRATVVLPLLFAFIALFLVLREIRESKLALGRRFDVVGHAAWAFTVLCAVSSLMAAFSKQPGAGWALAAALTGVGIGVAVLVWWDFNTPDSIFGQSKLQRRALIVLIIYGLCMQFGMVAVVTQVRNVLQAVYGYGPVLATVALAPYVLGMLVMVIYASRRLIDKDLRPLLVQSLMAGAVICVLIALTRAAGFYPLLALLLFLFGAAMVLAGTTFTFAFFISVPSDALGVRSGISSSVSRLGGSLGNSVAAGILAIYGAATYEQMLLAAGVPPERIAEALGALNIILDPSSPGAAVYPEVGSRLLAGYQVAYLASYERVLLITAAVCAIGSLLAWLALPRSKRTGKSEGLALETP